MSTLIANCQYCKELAEELLWSIVLAGLTFFNSLANDIGYEKSAIYAGGAFFAVLASSLRARYKQPPVNLPTPTLKGTDGK